MIGNDQEKVRVDYIGRKTRSREECDMGDHIISPRLFACLNLGIVMTSQIVGELVLRARRFLEKLGSMTK